ncbi:MAG: YicC family protein [Oscillospiraceae bacterium]|nr:YicC family protein [Oscillospiraceae bacterium]
MARSMTGFGQAEASNGIYRVRCEIKSVNHRYFEFSAHVPRAFVFLEERLKGYLSTHISRGKVECGLFVEVLDGDAPEVRLNAPLLKGYLAAFAELESKYGIPNDLCGSALLRMPELFAVEKRTADEEAVWAAVLPSVEEAAARFVAMRKAEGARLAADIRTNAAAVLEHVAFVEQRSPETVREYNEKLRLRMRELLEGAAVEEQRLLSEAAIFADKVAVAEETVRLRSHMEQLYVFLAGQEPIGRKLDFLVQEINREANTVGSKAQDIAIARHVVEMKALVEKIREQVQNLE